jgi:hypothetical protein
MQETGANSWLLESDPDYDERYAVTEAFEGSVQPGVRDGE